MKWNLHLHLCKYPPLNSSVEQEQSEHASLSDIYAIKSSGLDRTFPPKYFGLSINLPLKENMRNSSE